MVNELEPIVHMLLEGGADVNAVTADGSTALHIACEEGMVELAEYLMKRGANKALRNGARLTAVECAPEPARSK